MSALGSSSNRTKKSSAFGIFITTHHKQIQYGKTLVQLCCIRIGVDPAENIMISCKHAYDYYQAFNQLFLVALSSLRAVLNSHICSKPPEGRLRTTYLLSPALIYLLAIYRRQQCKIPLTTQRPQICR